MLVCKLKFFSQRLAVSAPKVKSQKRWSAVLNRNSPSGQSPHIRPNRDLWDTQHPNKILRSGPIRNLDVAGIEFSIDRFRAKLESRKFSIGKIISNLFSALWLITIKEGENNSFTKKAQYGKNYKLVESKILTVNNRSKIKPRWQYVFDVRGSAPAYEIFGSWQQVTSFQCWIFL